jgi:hypothetical protein
MNSETRAVRQPESEAGAGASEEKSAAASAPSSTKTLKHRYEFVATLMAMGKRNKDICELTGLTASRVSVLVNRPEIQKRASQIAEELRSQANPLNPDEELKVGEADAVALIAETIRDVGVKRQVRVDTAFRLLDRTRGKARQPVDNNVSGLADLFKAMNEMTRGPGEREVESVASALPPALPYEDATFPSDEDDDGTD